MTDLELRTVDSDLFGLFMAHIHEKINFTVAIFQFLSRS